MGGFRHGLSGLIKCPIFTLILAGISAFISTFVLNGKLSRVSSFTLTTFESQSALKLGGERFLENFYIKILVPTQLS